MKIETQKRGGENSKFPSCIPSLPPAAPGGFGERAVRDGMRRFGCGLGVGGSEEPERSEGRGGEREGGAQRGNYPCFK